MITMNRIYSFYIEFQASALLEDKHEKSFSRIRSYKVKQIRGNCDIDSANYSGI